MRFECFLSRVLRIVVLCAMIWSLCGCKTSMPWNRNKAENTTNTLFAALPARLPENPNMTQICQAVNENASRIGSLRSGNATLHIAQMGLPSMRTQFAYQTPRRMRITGSVLSAAGTAFDLGSNEDRFWFWVQGDPNVQYCRYDDYARVAASGRLLVDPKLVFEGLGVEQLGDDEQILAGPIMTSGLWAIQTQRPETSRVFTKWTYIDPRQGVPVYHVVQNALGQTIASVISKDFMQDAMSGALVPRRLEITISLPEGGHYVLELNLQDVAVNQSGVGATAWEMPSYSHTVNPVDLAVGIPASESYSAVSPMSLQMSGNPTGTMGGIGPDANASNLARGTGAGFMISGGGATTGNGATAYATPTMSPQGTASQMPAVATGSVTGWPSMSVAPNSYDASKYAATSNTTSGSATSVNLATGTNASISNANMPNTPAGVSAQGAAGTLPDFDLTGTPDYSILPEEVAGTASTTPNVTANATANVPTLNHPADPFLTASPVSPAAVDPRGTPPTNPATKAVAGRSTTPLSSLPPPPPESLTVNRMTGTVPVNPATDTTAVADATAVTGTTAVVWNSSDTVWESSDVDPLAMKRRTLVPNRATPPRPTGPTAASTQTQPEVILPAGVTKLW